MTVHHTLICFFFLTVLQDGNIGLINAQIPIFRATEGQSITVQCDFTVTGGKKYFCKDECEEKILEMYGVSAQRDRYSMRYKTRRGRSRLDVTITHLTKSDSGRYGCGLDRFIFTDPYQQFEIVVTDASTTTTTTTTTTTQSFRTTTSSAQTTDQSEQEQTAGGSGVLLYVGLTLVVIVLLFSVALLIFCKKISSKPKKHPEETEYANFTETSQVHEEIREGDGQSRSPPVENSVQTSVVYSVVTAAASRPLSKTEDDSSDVVYTQVDFSNRPAASRSSAPSGQADNVIYSAPR
ncbi:CMRF35-like molecule 1 isoform X3 [Scomber scombrus]|uniref:CMRF35-like molecule 1 isoform X3 n=1 Tax=Scomber scombrus TaxID=13677 RepID=UPI002DD986AF|nr:CMRF35-like molecule 1 isoform X3 [Scomber scombrus]